MTSILLSVKMAFAVASGFFVLAPACLLNAWTDSTYPSIKPMPIAGVPASANIDRKKVDEWKWQWLNTWYANSEDGVSGQQAYIWDANGNLVPYASTFPKWTPKWVVAYTWSAWRNNANNLKRPLRNDSLNIPWTPTK